jgi:aspartate carbamoyltransferase catalytic subunit
MTWSNEQHENLLRLEGMSSAEIISILDEARTLRDHARGDELNGCVIANLFFENSTRTRCSFETAAIRLGGHPINLSASGSSVAKGETLVDTALQFDAMGADVIVVRSGLNGGAELVAEACDAAVINAGDGRHEHPTQALLDFFVMREHLGDLSGKQVLIVGDITNSRVARSHIHGLRALGAEVTLVGPPGLVDDSFSLILSGGGVTVRHDFDAALAEADAIVMLRIQRERVSSSFIPSDYRSSYGMTAERASRLTATQIILHPGPVNRGVELDSAVLDEHPGSVVLEQVAAGVLVRAAVLMRAIRGSFSVSDDTSGQIT